MEYHDGDYQRYLTPEGLEEIILEIRQVEANPKTS
jgi:hypothetical protein